MIVLKDIDYIYNFPGSSTNYFQGNVGDKLRVVLTFEIFTSAVASTGEPFIFNNIDGYVGAGWITDDSNRFIDFEVGDTIRIDNYVTPGVPSDYTIIDKINDGAIQISPAYLVPVNTVETQKVISLKQDYEAIKYKYNFIENDEQVNYISKIDGSEHVMKADYLDASVLTPVSFAFLGNKSWQIGSAKISGVAKTLFPVYKNTFTITHDTVITPISKPSNFTDLINDVRPDYFKDNAALKYIFNIEAKRTNNSTVAPQIFEYLEEGNSGEFNENFNTGMTNYSADDILVKDPLLNPIPSIELSTNESTLTFKVLNTTDTPFSNGNTKYAFNICQMPSNETDVTNVSKTVIQNYFFDSVYGTVNDTFLPGANFGTDYQVIKEAKATFVSSSEILVTVKVLMDSDVVAKLQSQQDKNYLAWVSISDHTLSVGNTDRANLKLPLEAFYINPQSDGLISFSSLFLEEPKDNPVTEGVSLPEAFPHSELVGYTNFFIDKTDLDPLESVKITNIKAKIKCKHTVDGREFDLDSFNIDTTNLPIVSGNQYIDFAVDRPFHVPSAEKIKQITVKRRTDLDMPNQYYYTIKFPFLVRWEYWLAKADVDTDFFDVTEPNNGLNNFWARFDDLVDWKVYFTTEITIQKDGNFYLYSDQRQININDYDSNPLYFNHTIKSYDSADTELYDGISKRFILGYENTQIKVVFEKAVPFNPLLTAMVIDIETFENGGVSGRRRLSSTHVRDSDTWFLSSDTSNKVKLTYVGNTVIGECLLDKSQLPNFPKFTVTATLYDYDVVLPDGKAFQDGDGFLFQDGDGYIFQDQ